MGKTKKRQAKRAAVEAARLEQAWGASGERVGSALAAGGDGMHVGDARDANDPRWIAARDNAMDPDSRFKVAQVKLKRNPMAGVSKPKTKQKTGILRIARAVEASLTQEACVALDTLLAECERGEREVAAPMDLCGKVLAMCQRGSFGKPAIRLLGRMERVGLPVGPVQLRQVFFACAGKGMVPECLFPMTRFSQLRITHHQIPGNQGHLYRVFPFLIQIFPASLGFLRIIVLTLLTMFIHPG